MKLMEALDKPYPYKMQDRGLGTKMATFETDKGDKIIVILQPFRLNNEYIRALNFPKDMIGEKIYGVQFTRGKEDEVSITKGGDQFRIFATVAQIVQRFLKNFDPPGFFFSAKEPTRVRLYDRFAKQLGRKFKYDVKRGKYDGDTLFTFVAQE